MRKVVIAGNTSLQSVIQKWIKFWNQQSGSSVINYPKEIPEQRFVELYPNEHKGFFASIKEADIFFIANEEKKGIAGYIGAEIFAEIVFAIAQNLLEGKNIEILLANMPAPEVQGYHDVQLWLQLGWVKIFQK